MTDVRERLRTELESHGFDVDTVSENRGSVRVALRDDDVPADELRSLVEDALGADSVFGIDVAVESSDAETAVGTIVSFRYRD